MEHTKANCCSCNKELHIKVAKGENVPNRCICQTCSQGTPKKSPRRYITTGKYKIKVK